MNAPRTEHLAPQEVAALVEGRLSFPESEGARRHLATCPECRREVADVARILAEAPRARPRAVPVWAAAAAVAALVLGAPLLRWAAGGPGTDGLRAPTTELETLGPGMVRVGDAGGVRFIWSSGPPGSTFRVTLLDERGGRVWTAETGDTTVLLPPAIELSPGAGYYWYVDALAPDGRTLTAGPSPLEVR